MKLLIVDDSLMICRTIERTYSAWPFTQIETVHDGLLAIEKFRTFSPDVVTMDITMPEMDGLAALKEIISMNENAKVLVISALGDHHTAIEALSLGADQFICKPFTYDDLKQAMDELLEIC